MHLPRFFGCICALFALSIAVNIPFRALKGDTITSSRGIISINTTGIELNFPRPPSSGRKIYPLLSDEDYYTGEFHQVNESFFINNRKRDVEFEVAASMQVPVSVKGVPLEPAVASQGNYWFYTVNWGAAYTVNGGITWTTVNPFSDMPDFCCDQDVVYAPSQNIFVWFRQDSRSNTGSNKVRLTVMTSTFSSSLNYDITPGNLNSAWSAFWFDFPHIAITNSYFFFTTNVFSGNTFQHAVAVRIPLATMAVGGTITPTYIMYRTGTLVPVNGATTKMYIGSHVSRTQFITWKWDDASTTVTNSTVTHPIFSSTTYSCPGLDGYDWCGFMDSRPLAGWVSGGVVGFMWNAGTDSTHSNVFNYGIELNEANMAFLRQNQIYSTTYDLGYASVAVSSTGQLAASLSYGSSTSDVSHAFALYDSTARSWTLQSSIVGDSGSSTNRWGDYLRIRPHYIAGVKTTQFIGAGYAQQGGYCNSGNICSFAKPVVWLFGPVGGGTTAGEFSMSGASVMGPLVIFVFVLSFVGW